MKDKIIIVKIGNGYSLTICPETLHEKTRSNPKTQPTDLGIEKQKRTTKIGEINVDEFSPESIKRSHHQVWQKIHAA